MSQFKPFKYKTLQEIKDDIEKKGLQIDVSEDIEVLKSKVKVENYELPNSLAIHPMEGCDSNVDGSPSSLTIRRYKRFAAGGAGLLWFEAVAVAPEGKANPRQLMITERNVQSFKDIFNIMIDEAHSKFGKDHNPLCIMQLTHSGRFSRPTDKIEPIISYHNPYLNEKIKLDDSYPVISDDELEALEDQYVEAAKLAKEAGFHGVDVKACHRYLLSELLSAYEREGKYGGDFEGRTRLIRNIVRKIKSELGDDFIVATRLNIYDGIQFPYGWGVDKEDHTKFDLAEPLKLIGILQDMGVKLINVTMGTPYYNPHVNRPYDNGEYIPDESQLKAVERLLDGAGEIQKQYPDMVVVGTGYSWLRHLAPYFAAGNIQNGNAKIVGFGRESFAYPTFAEDIIKNGAFDEKKCCIACGKCTELMRAHTTTGCVIRDKEIYARLYQEHCIK